VREKYRHAFYLGSFIVILTWFMAMHETVGDPMIASTVTTTPIPESTKTSAERELILYREQYVKAGDALLAGKRYGEACLIYQKLLDILFKKSSDGNFDAWMGSYGMMDKQTDQKLRRAKALFAESRRRQLERVYSAKMARRISSSPPPSKVIKRREIFSHERGSLSIDGDLILTSLTIGSPLVSANQLTGVYLSGSGEKLYDEALIPDDRNNPQMHRWGRTYIIQNPVWAPDGSRYAYTINGALCVSDDGKGRPVIVSHIADNKSVNDIYYSWSPDGKKLVYVRSDGKSRTIFWNTCDDQGEQKIMEGDHGCFSQDSSKIAIVQGGKIFIYSTATGKIDPVSRGAEVQFCPDNRFLLITRTSKGKCQFILRSLSDSSEKELFTSDHPAFGRGVKSSCREPMFVSRNLIAFNVIGNKNRSRSCDIWIFDIESSAMAPLTRDGKSALREWVSTPSEVATNREILYLSR
jgi:hypothetical protein